MTNCNKCFQNSNQEIKVIKIVGNQKNSNISFRVNYKRKQILEYF